jgi:hypothetical protein
MVLLMVLLIVRVNLHDQSVSTQREVQAVDGPDAILVKLHTRLEWLCPLVLALICECCHTWSARSGLRSVVHVIVIRGDLNFLFLLIPLALCSCYLLLIDRCHSLPLCSWLFTCRRWLLQIGTS